VSDSGLNSGWQYSGIFSDLTYLQFDSASKPIYQTLLSDRVHTWRRWGRE